MTDMQDDQQVMNSRYATEGLLWLAHSSAYQPGC